MKSIEELVSEASYKYDKSTVLTLSGAFRLGGKFAIPLADKIAEDRTFERVLGALRKVPNMHERTFQERYMTHAEVIDWLLANRSAILGIKNEQGTKDNK
jgi:hypothetical protein